MAGAMRKAMVYLGLAEEDPRYTGYDDDEPEAATRPHRNGSHLAEVEPGPAEAHADRHGDRRGERYGDLHGDPTEHRDRPEREHRAEVTQLPRRVPVSQVVSDVEGSGVNRITTIHPRTYNEAKNIGEAFRAGTPVIMNLTDLDDADAKRLVDFAAGLVFGLQGAIERVTNKVFLLSPADVEVTSPDGEPTKNHKKLFNQS